ncbi:heat-shock protein Hsp20 [Candidatus Micrarchaeota archaeon CG08_land_8_20_14_0_20_59_11]|nr:MAG: heat-shock protein Hsp20 [Candidatus Micrarchaeota archaeon CG08_land_8_20_14_0_20_59_11]
MRHNRRMPFEDDFFSGFGDMDEIFERMMEDMKHLRGSGFGEGMKPGKGPFVYGVSMRVGQDGKPQISEFGNVEHGRVKEEREPLVDVLNGERELTVIVELPGVAKEHLKLNTTENALKIEVTDPQRRFAKRVALPAKVVEESAKAKLKNGILEVVLKKKSPERNAKTISVE